MNLLEKKICVIGIGYIGLPTAAMYASSGFKVVGYDLNENVVNALNRGEITIEEPQLGEVVSEVVKSGYLRATTKIEPADVFFIAVPTPVRNGHLADLSYIEQACEMILSVVKEGDIVVLESTSPPGTTDDIVVEILKKSGLIIGEELYIAHTPERVIPGKILVELVENSRIVGGVNQASSEIVAALFKTFVKGSIYITDAKTAEMCKVMENTFRDVNIALANEMAKICENMGISAWEVRELANHHPRVNLHIPGPGVGGHCIAVDPWFLVEKNPEIAHLIHQARKINDSMPMHTFNKAKAMCPEHANIVVMGITFKPDVDDMRESPIVTLVDYLKGDGHNVTIHDPHVKAYQNDLYDIAKGADLIILAVNHAAFDCVDFDKLYDIMKRANILDTRNQWSSLYDDSRFNYRVLGRG